MAAADPVADKSGFLCTYMSTHPDTLVAYVKHFGKIDGNVSSAKMLSINSKVRTTAAPPARTYTAVAAIIIKRDVLGFD
jgi:hypothetical protein